MIESLFAVRAQKRNISEGICLRTERWNASRNVPVEKGFCLPAEAVYTGEFVSKPGERKLSGMRLLTGHFLPPVARSKAVVTIKLHFRVHPSLTFLPELY